MSVIRRSIGVLALCALSIAPLSAFAQEIERIPVPIGEISAGYTFLRDFEEGVDDVNFPTGWYAAGAVNLNRWFGIVGEGTASYKNNFSFAISGLSDETNRVLHESVRHDARVYTFMAGPRFFRQFNRIAPFAQVLVGGAHERRKTTFRGDLAEFGTHTVKTADFAFQPGGGVTVFLNERVGLRFAADYRCIVDTEDDGDYANQFRILSGFTLNWGRR